MFSEEKFKLFHHYFNKVHDTNYPDSDGFKTFLCNSPVYDPDNLVEKLRIPSNDQL